MCRAESLMCVLLRQAYPLPLVYTLKHDSEARPVLRMARPAKSSFCSSFPSVSLLNPAISALSVWERCQKEGVRAELERHRRLMRKASGTVYTVHLASMWPGNAVGEATKYILENLVLRRNIFFTEVHEFCSPGCRWIFPHQLLICLNSSLFLSTPGMVHRTDEMTTSHSAKLCWIFKNHNLKTYKLHFYSSSLKKKTQLPSWN